MHCCVPIKKGLRERATLYIYIYKYIYIYIYIYTFTKEERELSNIVLNFVIASAYKPILSWVPKFHVSVGYF